MHYSTLFGVAAAILTPYQFINRPDYYTDEASALGVEEVTSASSSSSSTLGTSTRSIITGSIRAFGTEADFEDSGPLTVYVTSLVRVTVRTANHTNITLGTETTGLGNLLGTVYHATNTTSSLFSTNAKAPNSTTYNSSVVNTTFLTYDLHLNHTPKYTVDVSAFVTTATPVENTATTTPSSSISGPLETTIYLTPSSSGTALPHTTGARNYGTYLAPCLLLISLILLC